MVVESVFSWSGVARSGGEETVTGEKRKGRLGGFLFQKSGFNGK